MEPCLRPECDRSGNYARGFCIYHCEDLQGPCRYLNCDRPASKAGLCSPHYKRQWNVRFNSSIKVNFDPHGSGLVYVLQSPWIPELVKIGKTTRTPELRASHMSLPGLVVVASWRESAPWGLEKRLHAALDEFRLQGSEWFKTTPEAIEFLVQSWM